MEQENIQKDTPQEGANEQQYQSLEEAVFSGNLSGGSEGDISNVFTTGETGNTPEASAEQVTQPVAEQPSINQENVQQNNDEKRYQYWQSEADKAKNENAQLKAQLQNSQANVQTQPVHNEPEVEKFPDPPEKPQRPGGFSREEAMSDPQSQSARYLDEVEEWRDTMTEYTSLRTEYNAAVQQERMDAIEEARVNRIKKAQAQQKVNSQKNELADFVIGNHGFTENEAVEFVNTMSDPSSINLDNLVQLYRLKKGQPTRQAVAPKGPSQDFQQVQNAQQVPSPMGVMPSGQPNTDNRNMEDKIMDKMIGNFNSKNPWK